MNHARASLLLALGVCLLAGGVAGCGNNPHPKPLHEKRPDGSPWVVRQNYMPDEVRSLDPQVMADQMSQYVMEPVIDTLLAYHPMKTDPYEVMPQLLAALPERLTEADGSTSYLCRLQAGIPYHDDPCFPGGKGREVVAEDVQYAFQRMCDPSVQSPFFGSMAEHVAGMSEAAALAAKAGGFDYARHRVAGVEVLDPHAFKIHLTQPYPLIVYWMAQFATAPTPREAVEYYDGKEHPDGPKGESVVRPLFRFHMVGNGPFRSVEHVPGQRWRFERVEGYHTHRFPEGGWAPEFEAVNRPLAGHALPLVDELQFTIFRELLPIWLLTRQGYLDRMGVQKDAANAAITTSSELAEKYRRRGMSLTRVLEPSTFFFLFNMQDRLLGGNKKLRQALSCSYDAKGFSDMMYGGVAPVAEQLIPPGLVGFQKGFRNPYGANLDKGRRLLADAGYPEGRDPKTGGQLEITMDVVANGGEERQLAEYEQRQLQQLGIRVRLIENTFARMMEKQDQGNFQIATGSGWGADYPDAENFFNLFITRSFPPEGKNAGRYGNAEFDRLFAQMATMDNSPERFAIIKRMNGILIEDCPIILNFNKAYYVLVQPWAPLTHMNLLLQRGERYTAVDPVKREQAQRAWNPVPKWPLAVAGAVLAAMIAYTVRINRRRVA